MHKRGSGKGLFFDDTKIELVFALFLPYIVPTKKYINYKIRFRIEF